MTAEFLLAFSLQPVLADIGLSLLQLLLFFVSIWLIFLILIQRGKGGGLTAAFGGGGGDSAFGAKAGDAFTKITIVSALVWITLCMVTIARYNPPDQAVNPYAQADEQLPVDQGLSAGGAMMPAEGSETKAADSMQKTDGGAAADGGAATGAGASTPDAGGEEVPTLPGDGDTGSGSSQ